MTPKQERLWTAACVALGMLIYASTLDGGYTLDDVQSIRAHAGVHGPFSLRNIFWLDYWGLRFENTIGSYRPLATLTYWLDWHVAGGRPWVFHATNVAWYGVLLVVMQAFLRRWAGDTLSVHARLLVLAAFAALVIHTDVVPSPTGRTELMAATFTLLSMWAVLRPGALRRPLSVAVSTFALALAILSKESALPMTLVVPWVVARHHHRSATLVRRDLIVACAPGLAVLAAYLAFRLGRLPISKQGTGMVADNALNAFPWWMQKLGAAEVFTYYLEHTAVGLDLVPDYSYFALPVLHDGIGLRTVLGALVLVGLLALFVASLRRYPHLADAIVGFGGSYLVVSHLVVPATAMVANRLFFFPSFWLLTVLALLLVRLPKEARRGRLGPRRLVAIGVSGWIVVQGIVATAAATTWRDNAVLYTQALQTYPHVARTRVNFSLTLSSVGHHEEAAWHMLLAHAYYTRYPEPIPAELFPLRWDDLPMRERLVALRDALGPALFSAVMEKTVTSCREWNQDAEAALIAKWRREIAGVPR